MGLFLFLKTLRLRKSSPVQFDPTEYVPSFWEDDYCQTEMVPFENKAFIQKQTEQIQRLTSKSKTEYGFTETFAISPLPVSTISKEIHIDYFENTLTGFQFKKAKHIRYNKSEMLDCNNGKTKACGFSNFTIFFDTEDEFVKNIWIKAGLIVSAPQLDLIQDVLYVLGEECEFVLIDWHRLEIFDLTDRNQILNYLIWYWK